MPKSKKTLEPRKSNNDHLFILVHISDLHRKNNQNLSLIASTIMFDLHVLSQTFPELAEPDALVVSGDLVNQGGDPAQYSVTNEFLNKLYEDLFNHTIESDNHKLILIPGNHDVDYNFASGEPSGQLPEIHYSNEPNIPENSENRKFPLEKWEKRFLNFNNECLIKLTNQNLYPKNGSETQSMISSKVLKYDFELENNFIQQISFYGLNSAFKVHREDKSAALSDELKSIITDMILNEKSEEISRKEIRVLVFHHGYHFTLDSQLSTNGRADFVGNSDIELLSEYFNLALHGHSHQHTTQIRAKRGTKLPIIGAGSLFVPSKRRKPSIGLEYNIIVLNTSDGSMEVYPRRRDSDDNHWSTDGTWAERGKEFYSLALNDPDKIWSSVIKEKVIKKKVAIGASAIDIDAPLIRKVQNSLNHDQQNEAIKRITQDSDSASACDRGTKKRCCLAFLNLLQSAVFKRAFESLSEIMQIVNSIDSIKQYNRILNSQSLETTKNEIKYGKVDLLKATIEVFIGKLHHMMKIDSERENDDKKTITDPKKDIMAHKINDPSFNPHLELFYNSIQRILDYNFSGQNEKDFIVLMTYLEEIITPVSDKLIESAQTYAEQIISIMLFYYKEYGESLTLQETISKYTFEISQGNEIQHIYSNKELGNG